MNLFIIIFIAVTCQCFSQEITNQNIIASFSFLSDLQKLFPAKEVKQVQYEVDLNSGCLWVHTLILQPESGNFLITVYKNSTESIVAFEKGEIIKPENFFIGYAFVNGVAYQSNILSGKWEPAEMNDVLRKLKRFNYFTINTCADYQDSLSILNHNSTIIPKEKNHSGAKHLTNGIENIEYNSDNYKVSISKLSNDFITKWSVSNHSVLIRLITNEVILKSDITLPIISMDNNYVLPKSEIYSLFKTIENKPGLGIYYVKNKDGNFSIKQVVKDSPAYKAGINVGDVILNINGKPLNGILIDNVKNIIDESVNVRIKILNTNGIIIDKVIEKKLLQIN